MSTDNRGEINRQELPANSIQGRLKSNSSEPSSNDSRMNANPVNFVRQVNLLTVAETAEILRLGQSTVYELVSKGKIAGFRVGPSQGGVRVSQDDLDAYLASCRVKNEDAIPRRVSRPRLKHLKP